MRKPTVYIIILNWNGYKDTSELLESLFKITYENYKVIVVDNNSDQDDVENLKLQYGNQIQLVCCRDNLGFAGGNNVGIKSSLDQNADYVLLLNNDTVVEPGFLEPLLNKFDIEDQAGIVGPQINYYSEPKRVWSAGGRISKIRASGFALSDMLETENFITDKSVDFVSGCCMLIKEEVLKKVGLFDEKFFLYVEDADLCFRVKKAGYKIFIAHHSRIFHKVNTSTKNIFSVLPLYYTTRNRLYFAKKNFPYFFYLTVLYVSITMLLKSLVWLFTGQIRKITAVQNGFLDFFSDRLGKTEYNN